MITEKNIAYINVPQEMRDWALKEYRNRGEKYGTMYDPKLDPDRENVLIGYQGESVYKWMYPDAIHVDESDQDFMHFDYKVDVKTQKVRYYDFSLWFQIPEQDLLRKPDIYIFMQKDPDFTQAWVFGWMSHKEFIKKATKRTKGEQRFWREGKPPFVYHNKCRDVQAVTLHKLNLQPVVNRCDFASWWLDEVNADWSPQDACRRLKNI